MTVQPVSSRVDTTLAALADPTRRQVVDLLREGPRQAGDLAAAVGTSTSAMSRHVRVLRQGGLVEAGSNPADARLRVYRLRPEPFIMLQAWLDQVEAYWDEHLGRRRAGGESIS